MADHVWRLLGRLGVPSEHREESFQRVFLLTAERIGEAPLNAEQTLVRRVTVSVARDVRGSTHDHVQAGEPLGLLGVQSDPVGQGLIEVCDQLLSHLPWELRETFVLHELEKLPTREVAKVLGLSNRAVRLRSRRARENFRAEVSALQAQLKASGRGPRSGD